MDGSVDARATNLGADAASWYGGGAPPIVDDDGGAGCFRLTNASCDAEDDIGEEGVFVSESPSCRSRWYGGAAVDDDMFPTSEDGPHPADDDGGGGCGSIDAGMTLVGLIPIVLIGTTLPPLDVVVVALPPLRDAPPIPMPPRGRGGGGRGYSSLTE